MTKSNKKLESEIRELEKRVLMLEEKVLEIDHHVGIRRVDDEVLSYDEAFPDRAVGRIAGTYNPKTGVSTEGGNYRIGCFDPNEPVKGDAVNRGVGNDALIGFEEAPKPMSGHPNTLIGYEEGPVFKSTAYDADLPVEE